MLTDKKIILGISGGIAAYKVADWVRKLRREGAGVQVVMTGDATRFVTPLTFAALSGRKVYEGMFDPNDVERIPHISLAAEADLILIAPATAQTIARLASGMADDLPAALVLAHQSPVIICPAMNCNMYLHPATQANLDRLKTYGYRIVEPGRGSLACDTEGPGRLADWSYAKEAIYAALTKQNLADRKVLVTAGPTHEPLDPVRYLGNRSSGRMGFALAVTARRRGAEVTLVTGPSELPDPPEINVIRISSAEEMAAEVLERCQDMDVIVKAAAVSDFRPAEYSAGKLKKAGAGFTMNLTENPDILKTLGERKGKSPLPLLVGFAAESGDFINEGRRKLREKNLDLLAINDITSKEAGFGVETNRITLLNRNGDQEKIPLLSKEDTADLIWKRVADLLAQ
ncbi:MAG: bifunctional phosphopantothenoylcysteine decarboxylase/phosphopantothenate--cysteine ligase CoaBC [Desulfurivibrionaceae bacterium]|nr:bifunctional phosphopantothenoylcysteine decarboxylase/phosphopantothenate--cysteine ligase CoaBC [Desulfurivibrionaceae bacterium]